MRISLLMLSLVVSNTSFSIADSSLLKDILHENRCNVLLFYSKHLTSSWNTLALPHVAINDSSTLTSSFVKSIIGKSRLNCSVAIGHLSDIANVTTTQMALATIDHLTLYLFTNSLNAMPSDAIIRQPTIVIVEGTGNLGTAAIFLQCPMKGSQGIVNIWSHMSGFLKQLSSWHCNAYLNGQHIIVSTVAAGGQPVPFLEYNSTGQVVGGAEIDILRAASRSLNFTFELTYSPAFIYAYPGGGWGGVVGMVKNQTAALGISPFRMTELSYKAVDFVHFVYPYDYTLFCPSPRPIVPITNLIEPFSGSVWIAVASTTLLVTFCYFVWSWSPSTYDKHIGIPNALMASLMEAFRTNLNQNHTYSITENPPSKSMMVLFWFIGDFFIKSFYTCLLLTYLLSIRYEPPINSLEDLYEQNRPLYLTAGTQMYNSLALSPNPVQQAFAQQAVEFNRFLIPYKSYMSFKDEKELLQNRGCFLNYKWSFYGVAPLIISRWGKIPWRASPEAPLAFYGSYITQKHAPYNDELRRFLMHIPDSGLTEYFFTKYIAAQYLNPPKEEDPPPAPLTYLHFLGAFVLLACFGVLTTLIFLAEVVKGNMRQ